ncbi:MAG: GldG family protein [Acidobacteria bacterium]|nr:GldG family protein [Acidobacteriota bacterium]
MGIKDKLTSRQAKYGLNTALYALAALAIVVIFNLIVLRAPTRLGQYNTNWQWDLTANRRYSLSPQAVQVLSNLDRDVQIIYFDRQNNFGAVRDLLDQFPTQSQKVSVSYFDPDRERAKATQYNIKEYGKIVVVAGDKNEQAKGVKEEDVINTIIRVLKGGAKNIYFLTGHGEREIDSTERLGFSEAKKALQGSNYEIKTLSLLQEKPEIPADCKVLVIAGPQKDLLDPEIAAIKQYMAEGGRVFFLLSPFTPPKIVKLLAGYGADVSNTLVVDMSGIGRLFGTDELMPLALQYDPHPITKDMANTATLFPFSTAVRSSADSEVGAEFQLIAKTAPNSWATKDVHAKQVSFREGQDFKGPLALAGAGVYRNPDALIDIEARFVVSGSADLIANAILEFNGNRDLFLNMMNWLSSDEDLIAVRPKDPEERPVNLSPNELRMVFYFTFLILPLAVVLGGLGVWWKRRG